MISWFRKTYTSYLNSLKKDDYKDLTESSDDALLWARHIERHSHGEFSLAVAQANAVLEDHSQVEAGPHATFIGVYDGHGGDEVSRYISDHLSAHLLRLAREGGGISEDIIRNAFSQTENGFLARVRRDYATRPLIASIGSCCLVGVIWNRTLYVANLGDSRAVLGSSSRFNKIVAEQLTQDQNVSVKEVRTELQALHPEDSQIVVKRHGVWRVKGIIQISRSIGDAYLKSPEFALGPSFPRFHLPVPLSRGVLRADPDVITRNIRANDRFVIFASDGLWNFLTNQEAVKIVNKNSRVGIARRLIMAALKKAARIMKGEYSEIKALGRGTRRNVHDDITVVVVFMDHSPAGVDRASTSSAAAGPDLSVRGYVDAVGPSIFHFT
ncbi:hypothetical protein OROGR_006712 [Orobanche gracilis]